MDIQDIYLRLKKFYCYMKTHAQMFIAALNNFQKLEVTQMLNIVLLQLG